MFLYHLTHVAHLVEIENDGFLEVTESNIGAPEILDGEALPLFVAIYVPTTDGSLSENHPSHPEFRPMVMPRQIYMAMHDRGEAPPRLDMGEFRVAIEPLTEEINGQPSVPLSIVVGYEPDSGKVTTEPGRNSKGYEEILTAAGKYGDHVGPDVVWLTDDPTPRQNWQALRDQPDMPYMFRKDAVLFTVEVPDEEVRCWDEWSHEQGIMAYWYDALDEGTGDAKHWYVLPRRIPKDEWVSIHNTETGSLYWSREQGHVEGDDRFSQPAPAAWYATALLEEI